MSRHSAPAHADRVEFAARAQVVQLLSLLVGRRMYGTTAVVFTAAALAAQSAGTPLGAACFGFGALIAAIVYSTWEQTNTTRGPR